jgi:hypothetical protein
MVLPFGKNSQRHQMRFKLKPKNIGLLLIRKQRASRLEKLLTSYVWLRKEISSRKVLQYTAH